jgi:hypothetical protein
MSYVKIEGNASGTGTFTIAAPNTNTDYSLTLPETTGGEFVVTDSSGNVGIGTSSPASKFHVNGGGGVISFGTHPTALSEIKHDTSVNAYTVYNNKDSAGHIFQYNGTESVRIDQGNLKFNSGYGSVATAYGCRAWVNFNGTGTVAIRGSGNVSSITDGGAGNYTVNFTTAMPDTNYSVSGMAMQTNTSAAWARVININTPGSGSTADVKTTSIGIWVFKPSTEVSLDTEIVCLSIFR